MAATDSPETTTTREPHRPRATTPEAAGGRSGRATAAMILGIVSIPAALIAILGILLGLLAVTFGALARGDVRRRGLTNHGQAMAGIVLGSIGVVLGIANLIAGVIVATS